MFGGRGGGVQVTGTHEPVLATEQAASCPQGSGFEGGFASAGHLPSSVERAMQETGGNVKPR